MVITAVSAIALALTFGPQLQVNLQAALEPAITGAETITEAEAQAPEPDAERSEDNLPDQTQPMAAIEDTPIVAQDIGAPTIETGMPEDEQSASAADPEPAPVQSGEIPSAEWPEILAAASAALEAATTASGQFVQTNADGSVSNGTFALRRPGRMRFDYADPTPVLIVSDGTTVAMEDRELETVDRVPIGSTPLGLILSTQLNVDEDIQVLGIIRNQERVGIRVRDARGELDGTLTMVFDKTTYDLLGWLAVDGNFQTTVVDLLEVETNIRVDPRLFRLEEADDEEDER